MARERALVGEELRPGLEVEAGLDTGRHERLQLARAEPRAAHLGHPQVAPAVVFGQERDRLAARIPHRRDECALWKVEVGACGQEAVEELARRLGSAERAPFAEGLAVEGERNSGLRIVHDAAVLAGKSERDIVARRRELRAFARGAAASAARRRAQGRPRGRGPGRRQGQASVKGTSVPEERKARISTGFLAQSATRSSSIGGHSRLSD